MGTGWHGGVVGAAWVEGVSQILRQNIPTPAPSYIPLQDSYGLRWCVSRTTQLG